jgi:RNA polymerase sigma factor (sigma-70 family)
MQETDDSAQVRQYAENNSEEAFTALVARHVNLVYSVALRQVGNPHHSEEITQAVFIILAKKAAQLLDVKTLSSWLFQATRLTANNFVRSEMRRQRREQEAHMQSILNESETEIWPRIAPLLDAAVAALNEKDRRAIVLRFYEGRNLREVGTILGASEDAAEKRIKRAVEKLQKFFLKRGVSSTTATLSVAISANSVQAAPVALAKTATAVALAKGTTASISTLTLIKGALKIMAWTKTKTVIVAGVVVLLAAGTTTLAVKAVNAARTKAALGAMQGDWEGTLAVNQARLRLVLKIFKTNDVYHAVLDSIDQGAKDIPIARLSARSDSIHVELPGLDAVYQATLNADGTQMSGKWKQLKLSFPLTLKRTTEPDRVAETLLADEYAPRPDSDLQGAWEGTLNVGNAGLRLNLRIAEPAAGTFNAEMDSVDQGVKNLPVTSVTYQKPAIRFEMTGINGKFEGNVDERDDQMTGTWTQMGKKYPLTFQRTKTNTQTTAVAEKDYGQGASYQVQGHWKGALNVKNATLHIVFHIALMPDGSYSATMDSPDQGATGIPASAAEFTFPNVRLEWAAMGGVFTGKLENGKLSGSWGQGKTTFPLKLERSAAE